MSEENIIKYDFGNNDNNEEGDNDLQSTEGEIIEHDFSSVVKRQKEISKSFEEGFMLGEVIRKINRLNPSQNSIIQSDALVKDYTKEEVFDWLKNATDQELNKRPGFYFSLLKKYRNSRRIG